MTPLQELAKLLGTSRDDLLKRLAKGPLTITTSDNVIVAEIKVIDGCLSITQPKGVEGGSVQ